MEKFLFKKIELWLVLLIGFLFWAVGAMAVNSAKGDNRFGRAGKISSAVLDLPNSVIHMAKHALPKNTHAEVPDHVTNSLPKFFKSSTSTVSNEKSLYAPEFRVPVYRVVNGNKIFSIIDPSTSTIDDWHLSGVPATYSSFDDTMIVRTSRGEQDSTKGLAKMNRQGDVIWSVDIQAHHAIYVDAEGYIYSPTKNTQYNGVPKNIFKGPGEYRDDGYVIISPRGDVVQEGSITKILLDNGLGYFIYGVGAFEGDAIHLNSVKPAPFSKKNYQKGDLLFSLRHQSMIFMYRPSTKKIIWYQVGPWTNQHDPDFLPDGNISLFGNDVASMHRDRTDETAALINGYNDIYVFDPETRSISKPYTEFMSTVKLSTVTAGAHNIYSDGSLAVHFSNQGILAYYQSQNKSVKYYYLLEDGMIKRDSGLATLLH